MSGRNCFNCGRWNAAGAGSVCYNCSATLSLVPAPQTQNVPAPGPSELPIDFPFEPFTCVGDVLRPTIQLFREHSWLVGKIALATALPLAAFEYAVSSPLSLGVGSALNARFEYIASTSLMSGALIYGIVTLLRTGASPSLMDCIAWGLKQWWKLAACLLVSTIVVWLGIFFLIIPGVFMALVFAVALPALVVEDLGPIKALERSGSLTHGRRGLVFGAVLIFTLIAAAVWLLTVGTTWSYPSFFVFFVNAFVTQLLAAASTTLSLFMYLGLRAERGETPAPAALAAQTP